VFDEVASFRDRIRSALDEFDNGDCIEDYADPRLRQRITLLVDLLRDLDANPRTQLSWTIAIGPVSGHNNESNSM